MKVFHEDVPVDERDPNHLTPEPKKPEFISGQWYKNTKERRSITGKTRPQPFDWAKYAKQGIIKVDLETDVKDFSDAAIAMGMAAMIGEKGRKEDPLRDEIPMIKVKER